MTNRFYVVTRDGITDGASLKSTVLALGSFDGVHAAHRTLIDETVSLGKRLQADSIGAWCFSTIPASHFGNSPTPMLSALEEKIDMLLSLGLDFVAVGDFPSLCALSPCDFAYLLKEELGCIGCSCGFNHRFGKGGEGDPSLLVEIFGKDNIYIMPEFSLLGLTVSSSSIRELISSGDVEQVKALLGRPFSLRSKVVQGKHLGHKLGFPTANQRFHDGIVIPKHGIYATISITKDGRRFPSVSNVGIRPTITDGSDEHVENCETHIYNFDESIYGEILTVEFHKYLRQEKRFESINALKEQISIDLESSCRYFEELDIKS